MQRNRQFPGDLQGLVRSLQLVYSSGSFYFSGEIGLHVYFLAEIYDELEQLLL